MYLGQFRSVTTETTDLMEVSQSNRITNSQKIPAFGPGFYGQI
jgi:hypothetical protein